MIEENGDDDSLMFQLDFLVLFMSGVVESQLQGKCKLDYLRHFTEETKVEDVDRCTHIMECIKKCKDNWKTGESNKKFAGPLLVLLLMYVDRAPYAPVDIEPRGRLLKNWTFNKLHEREEFEMMNGGFGLRGVRDLYLDMDGDERDEEEKDDDGANGGKINSARTEKDDETVEAKPSDLIGHVNRLSRLLANMVDCKKKLEHALHEACSDFLGSTEVKGFIEKYKSTCMELAEIDDPWMTRTIMKISLQKT